MMMVQLTLKRRIRTIDFKIIIIILKMDLHVVGHVLIEKKLYTLELTMVFFMLLKLQMEKNYGDIFHQMF